MITLNNDSETIEVHLADLINCTLFSEDAAVMCSIFTLIYRVNPTRGSEIAIYFTISLEAQSRETNLRRHNWASSLLKVASPKIETRVSSSVPRLSLSELTLALLWRQPVAQHTPFEPTDERTFARKVIKFVAAGWRQKAESRKQKESLSSVSTTETTQSVQHTLAVGSVWRLTPGTPAFHLRLLVVCTLLCGYSCAMRHTARCVCVFQCFAAAPWGASFA